MATKKSIKKPTAKPTKRDDLLKAKSKKVSKKKPSKSKTIDLTSEAVQVSVNDHSVKLTPPVETLTDKFMSSTPPKGDDYPAFLRPAYENCCSDHNTDLTDCVEQHTPFQRLVRSVKGFLGSLITAVKHST